MSTRGLRIGYGAALVTAPAGPAFTRAFCRVLGLRYLVEAAVVRDRRIVVGVDAVHCATMIAAAAAWGEHRRLFTASACASAAIGAAELALLRAAR